MLVMDTACFDVPCCGFGFLLDVVSALMLSYCKLRLLIFFFSSFILNAFSLLHRHMANYTLALTFLYNRLCIVISPLDMME